MATDPHIWGLMAEFEDAEKLLEATEQAYAAGYRRMDAYSPFPVEGLAEALGFHHTRLSAVVLAGGIAGAVGGFAMQYFSSVFLYPINSGGRPYNSWPAFIPITFETTILVAALAAVLGMLALNGLPQPYHPVFNVENFTQASRHRFFLAVESDDEQFDLEETHRFLLGLEPAQVSVVDR